MKTKFKIGDPIFFMKDNEVQQKKVTGIATYQGEIKELHKEVDAKEPLTEYHCEAYCTVKEKDAFATSDDLKHQLFTNIKS